MKKRDDFDDAEEGLVDKWFEALREIVPGPSTDLSQRVLERLEVLRDEERLKGPPVDGIAAGFLTEIVNLLSRWLSKASDDKKP